MADHQQSPAGRTELPFARGRSFATLDEYLAHLESLGPQDAPWYLQVEPGVYELQGRRSRFEPAKRYTRAELAEKYGFSS